MYSSGPQLSCKVYRPADNLLVNSSASSFLNKYRRWRISTSCEAHRCRTPDVETHGQGPEACRRRKGISRAASSCFLPGATPFPPKRQTMVKAALVAALRAVGIPAQEMTPHGFRTMRGLCLMRRRAMYFDTLRSEI